MFFYNNILNILINSAHTILHCKMLDFYLEFLQMLHQIENPVLPVNQQLQLDLGFSERKVNISGDAGRKLKKNLDARAKYKEPAQVFLYHVIQIFLNKLNKNSFHV